MNLLSDPSEPLAPNRIIPVEPGGPRHPEQASTPARRAAARGPAPALSFSGFKIGGTAILLYGEVVNWALREAAPTTPRCLKRRDA
jgi:hypothetical protein